MQFWGIQSPLSPYVLPQISGRIYANTGQPNHLANYLCLGLASLAYLHGVGRLALLLALATAVPLLLVLTVSGSRSIWIYLAALVVLGVPRLRPQPAALRILGFGIACVCGFLAMQWLADFLLASAALPIETIQARMGSRACSPDSGCVCGMRPGGCFWTRRSSAQVSGNLRGSISCSMRSYRSRA